MKSILKSPFFSLGLLLALSLLLISVTNHCILTLNFFDNSGEYLSGNPASESEVYEALQKYIYFLTIIYIAFKVLIIALIIYNALYLADQQINFIRVLNIVIHAEYIFLLPAVLKIIWFKFEYPSGNLAEWHKVYIFSALSIAGDVSADWYYPLQSLNLFEIAYWFLLAYGVFKATSLTYDQSLKIIMLSYLPLLFIWIITVVFCTVMIFPGNA